MKDEFGNDVVEQASETDEFGNPVASSPASPAAPTKDKKPGLFSMETLAPGATAVVNDIQKQVDAGHGIEDMSMLERLGTGMKMSLAATGDVLGAPFRLAGSLSPQTRGHVIDETTGKPRIRTALEALQNPGGGLLTPVNEKIQASNLPEPLKVAGQLGTGLVEGAGVGELVGGVRALAGKLAPTLDNLAVKIASKVNDIPEEAITMQATASGRKAMAKAFKNKDEINAGIVDAADNFGDIITEEPAVQKALEQAPPIPTANLIDALEKSRPEHTVVTTEKVTPAIPGITAEEQALKDVQKKYPSITNPDAQKAVAKQMASEYQDIPGTPEVRTQSSEKVGATATADKGNKFIDDLISRINKMFPNGQAPAKDYINKVRRIYDDEAGAAFNKDEKKTIDQALLAGRSTIESQVKAAAPPSYAENINAMFDKLSLRDKLYQLMGKNAATRESRIEWLQKNLWGADKQKSRDLIDKLGNLFGQDFLQQSKLAYLAGTFGETGVPTLLPKGGAMKAIGAAAAAEVGAAHYHLPGLALINGYAAAPAAAVSLAASPKIATRFILPANKVLGKIVPERTLAQAGNKYARRGGIAGSLSSAARQTSHQIIPRTSRN